MISEAERHNVAEYVVARLTAGAPWERLHTLPPKRREDPSWLKN
jgi:hypothetical protein